MKLFRKSAGLTDVGFWERFWSRFSARPRLERGDEARPFDSHTSDSGAIVGTDTSLRLSAVWACVGLRADTLASFPLHVQNPDKTLAKDHPLYELLHTSPNADMTMSEYFAFVMVSMDLWGNSYSVIERNSQNRIIALTPIIPEYVTVKRESGRLVYRDYTKSGIDPKVYDEARILHFRGLSIDGIIGLSPIQYAAETVGGQMSANRAAAKDFANSLKAGGFLKTPGNSVLDPTTRGLIDDRLSFFARPENAGKMMLLEAGIEVTGSQSIRMNPKDAQLLESRRFGIEEICRAYRTPPPLIGHMDKASSWASSLSGLNQGFLTYAMMPLATRMEQRMMKQLLAADDRLEHSVKFNMRGLQRGNFAEQMQGYVSALNNGVYNLDEVRDLEDWPPLPDGLGKVYRGPLNMAPLSTEPPEPPAPPAPVPAPTPAPTPAPAPAKELAALWAQVQELKDRPAVVVHPARVEVNQPPINVTVEAPGPGGGKKRIVYARDPDTGRITDATVTEQ